MLMPKIEDSTAFFTQVGSNLKKKTVENFMFYKLFVIPTADFLPFILSPN